jgi:glycosyltransferase involved in cell wall biosynthesis
MTPAISVCVPTYNGEKYLRECLDSVLAQTFDNFEVVAVDDDSSDGTVEILEAYAARDRRVRLFRNPQNLGLVNNWNHCMDLARGEWIKFVFQDDRIEPSCLQILLQRSRPGVPLTVCRRRFVYDENIPEEERIGHEQYLAEHCLPALLPEGGFISSSRFCDTAIEKLPINFVGEPSAVMLHRSVPGRFGGFNPSFVQLCDFEYWTRIACHSGLIFVPEVLASFRLHSGGKTAVNKTAREFHTEVIDSLLLKYEFAYEPYYAAMRAAARKARINLARSVAESARRAEKIARRWAKDILIPDDSAVAEWNAIRLAYPKLRTSRYARTDRWNNELERRLLWRFRGAAVRFRNRSHRCPVVICVDVEPDDMLAAPGKPAAWKGFEQLAELFSTVRPRLASATGHSVHYAWMLRMDPQVVESHGAADWLVRRYGSRIEGDDSLGDEIALHSRAQRWDGALGRWVSEYKNQAWVDHCVTTSFKAFRAAFGRGCKSFRFGAAWMSNRAIALLEELGARFDLSLHGGISAPSPNSERVDKKNHPPRLPLTPYRPALGDFGRPDRTRKEGLWIIPLSAGVDNVAAATKSDYPIYRSIDLASATDEFEWLVNTLLRSRERPYLALKISSSIGIKPSLMRNLTRNISSFLMHPLADRFVVCTPAAALSMLNSGRPDFEL